MKWSTYLVCRECHKLHECVKQFHKVRYGPCDRCGEEDFLIDCER
jgi:hypothetical protein